MGTIWNGHGGYRQLAVAVAALVLFAGGGGAESYRVQLGDLPPAYIPDAWSYSAQIEIDPPPAKSRAVIPSPKDPGKFASPRFRASREAGAVKLAPPAKPQAPRSQVVPDVYLEPTKDRPTKDFLAQISKAYRVTKPAEQQAVWKWFQAEPATLKETERLENAFIRYTMAEPAPDRALRVEATEGTVKSEFPLMMRQTPFGAKSEELPNGSKFKILPPPDGAWYRVETPQGIGWVCGLWVEAK
ncbi:MAG: SH3 domain-containing protein [Candidatus Wallbacteria bacterium]|nr:SH3 domain-containing protein [Candidatus Wallbacteria bacterium]